jgi:hypothetical protein
MVIVFKGQGNIKAEETAFYNTLPNVKVVFQPKAWVDGSIEVKVFQLCIKPEVDRLKASYAAAGKEFPGYLLIEDNFSAHQNEYGLLFLFYL